MGVGVGGRGQVRRQLHRFELFSSFLVFEFDFLSTL